MHNTNKHESICLQLISVTVFLVLLTTGLWISEGLVVWAGDEEGVYSDKAGGIGITGSHTPFGATRVTACGWNWNRPSGG
jgi:hypothetical protein